MAYHGRGAGHGGTQDPFRAVTSAWCEGLVWVARREKCREWFCGWQGHLPRSVLRGTEWPVTEAGEGSCGTGDRNVGLEGRGPAGEIFGSQGQCRKEAAGTGEQLRAMFWREKPAPHQSPGALVSTARLGWRACKGDQDRARPAGGEVTCLRVMAPAEASLGPMLLAL